MEVFSTDLLVYRSAIYPQGRTLKYGQEGGRLGTSMLLLLLLLPDVFGIINNILSSWVKELLLRG